MKGKLAQVLLFVAEQLLAEAPALFNQIVTALNKPSVTVEDLRALRNVIAEQHYKDFVPGTQIPPEQQT
jgi:hypothetical protein